MIADIRYTRKEIPEYFDGIPTGINRQTTVLQVRYWEDADSQHQFMGDWEDVRTESEVV